MNKSTTLLFLYTKVGIDAALTAAHDATVVCFDFWLERLLKQKNIAFTSLADYKPPGVDMSASVDTSRHVAREWYRVPEMQFFSHKGVPLGEAFEPMLEIYLIRLLYYRMIFGWVLDANPHTQKLVVPHSGIEVSATTGPLAHFEARAAVDAACALAAERGLSFRAIGGEPASPQRHVHPASRWQTLLVVMYNTLISLAPRKLLKVYASEYWRNIAPFVTHMKDLELVLMDRSELRHIPWRERWRHRVRLAHPLDAEDSRARAAAREAAEAFRHKWATAKESPALQEMFTVLGWSLVEPALTYLVCAYAERIVAEIESIEKILTYERPTKVLLRASIGGRQHHFFIITRVARQLGVPSIELQHAGAYVDPRSVYSRLETDLLASYGAHENAWYERNGYASARLVAVGSPRFDRCLHERGSAAARGKNLLKDAGLDLARPMLLAAVPEEGLHVSNDSYALAEFFRALRAVRDRAPGLQIVFKFRPGNRAPQPRAFVRELFGASAACMDREDLFALLCSVDVAVCGNSTVIYEAMLAEVPLLLHPWRRSDIYHAELYQLGAPILYDADGLADAAARALADPAYRETLHARQKHFLAGYSFDGKSSERIEALLRQKLSARVAV